jgi:hypothetical protein
MRSVAVSEGALASAAVGNVTLAGILCPLPCLGGGHLFEPRWWRWPRWRGGPAIAGGGSGRWPVVLAPCAEHREPSRLDEVLEVLAQVRYQVGFASLEPNLGVGGELVLPGVAVPA